MKRLLAVLAGFGLSAVAFVGVASGSHKASSISGNTTKTSVATITHTCTETETGGGMAADDMDKDGDTISITGPTVLWPPNHKYVTETITASDVDGASEAASDPDGVTLMTIASSNQPELGMGSGHTLNDAVAEEAKNGPETATQEVKLRAERDGVDPTKAGRTYTMNVTATFDNNPMESCHATFTVHVPHDQRH